MSEEIRVRFAPSPTGHLHIGGARTAIFNWLYARSQKATFILRVEDTDRERSTEEYVRSILEGLEWLGLDWDEGPYHQLARMDIYKSHVEKLLTEGKAYKCYCTSEELEERKKTALARGEKPKYDGRCRSADQNQSKPFCIRFKTSESGETEVRDLIKGEVVFQNTELDDLVVQRTDGVPTYNLCVVIDDALMRVTQIIRGDDHLNNTPRQILLYQAFGYPLPEFAHLPMILGADKTRLSKRHGATSVLAYREMGYLPDAMINFLARIGWSHGDQEIFTRDELVDKFSLDHVGKSGGVFNAEKLLWLNSHYIKTTGNKTLAVPLVPHLESEGIRVVLDESLYRAVGLCKERARTLVELVQMVKPFIMDEVVIEEAARGNLNPDLLKDLLPILQEQNPFDEMSLKATFEKYIADKKIKLGVIAQPLRAALTGSTVSPGIFEVLSLLGKEKVIKRIRRALA
ncbi:MAG: glutamate--tRNA ligase [Deltaproteobacteria bacterium]|nr:glutamate--tRNA ligase [Deltaproteobacteria bacterium]MBI4373327.1 glutamate--tRNA ligase [Deltaproteobacteria bacterium]